jgi:signal peptidase I
VADPAPEAAAEPAPAPASEAPAELVPPAAAAATPAGPAVREPGERRRRSEAPVKHRSFLRELPFLVVIAFVLALLIKHFLVQAFYIPSGSMEQTLQVGDRVLVNKVPYRFHEPHRGDIVVFNGLDNFDEGVTFAQPGNPVARALRKVSSTIGLGTPDEKDYIKRVIGIPGDRVMCCDPQGRVVVTPRGGTPASLDEPYIYQPDLTDQRYFCDAGQGKQVCPPGAPGVLVPKGRLWVMGDHRGNSSDSRAHLGDAHRGTVPEDKVVGKAFWVVFPLGHAHLLHAPATFRHLADGVPAVGGVLGAVPVVLLRRRRTLRKAAQGLPRSVTG